MRTQFASIWEAVADVVPDQTAIVQGERRLSWREYEQRAARLAGAIQHAGIGPGGKVGMYLYNSPEYCETNFAALKVRSMPINVNYRYLDNELLYLLENADVEGLMFHTSLADRVARVAPHVRNMRLLVEVKFSPSQTSPREKTEPPLVTTNRADLLDLPTLKLVRLLQTDPEPVTTTSARSATSA